MKIEKVFLDENINVIFNNFLILIIFNARFPIVKVKKSCKSKPWLTKGIKISCSNKKKLCLNYRNSSNPYHKEHCKRYCWTLTMIIIRVKCLYYDKLISESNNKQKTSWNIIKTITNNNNINSGLSLNISGTLTTDPLLTGNAFNICFISIAENLTKNFSRCDATNSNGPVTRLQWNFHPLSSLMRLINTTTYKISKIIHSLNSKDSHGYDEISSKILKVSAPCILSPLTYIFNKVL